MAEKMKTCGVCGAEIAASAKTCPSCGGKNKKPVYKKWWFWVLLVVIVAAIAAGAGGKKSGQPSGSTGKTDGGSYQQETVSYTHYNVTELFDALRKNALSAEKTYNGQYVEIEGYLGTIDSSGKYICVEASSDNYDYLFESVQCYIKSAEQTDRVMEMSAGDPITVRGKITVVGEVLGYSLDIDSID